MDGLQGFTVEEVAQRATVSTKQVYRDIKAGNLRATRIGRRLIVTDTALRDYLNGESRSVRRIPPPPV